jgi:hypothetical protein
MLSILVALGHRASPRLVLAARVNGRCLQSMATKRKRKTIARVGDAVLNGLTRSHTPGRMAVETIGTMVGLLPRMGHLRLHPHPGHRNLWHLQHVLVRVMPLLVGRAGLMKMVEHGLTHSLSSPRPLVRVFWMVNLAMVALSIPQGDVGCPSNIPFTCLLSTSRVLCTILVNNPTLPSYMLLMSFDIQRYSSSSGLSFGHPQLQNCS